MYLIKGLMDLPSSGSTLEMDCNTNLVLFIDFTVSIDLKSVWSRVLTSNLGFEDISLKYHRWRCVLMCDSWMILQILEQSALTNKL